MEITTPSAESKNELLTVWEASVRATHDFLTEQDIQIYKALIKDQYLDSLNVFCIRRENSVAGFIGLNGNTIQMLFIHPDFMSKGIGKALINYAVAEHGANEVAVNEQNTAALGFYKSIGFEVSERFETDGAGKPYPILSLALKRKCKNNSAAIQ